MVPKSTLLLNVVLTELTSPLNFAPLKTGTNYPLT
jgi:hypothetical protein